MKIGWTYFDDGGILLERDILEGFLFYFGFLLEILSIIFSVILILFNCISI